VGTKNRRRGRSRAAQVLVTPLRWLLMVLAGVLVVIGTLISAVAMLTLAAIGALSDKRRARRRSRPRVSPVMA